MDVDELNQEQVADLNKQATTYGMAEGDFVLYGTPPFPQPPPPPKKIVGFWGSGDGDGSLRVPPFWDRMLRKDKEEAEAIKNAKALEEEKAMYSVSSAPPTTPPF